VNQTPQVLFSTSPMHATGQGRKSDGKCASLATYKSVSTNAASQQKTIFTWPPLVPSLPFECSPAYLRSDNGPEFIARPPSFG
jgi:hypothetical protein